MTPQQSHLTPAEIKSFAWVRNNAPKTEEEAMSHLDTCGYYGKFKRAKEVAAEGTFYWNNVVEEFLARGGLLKAQLYNHGLNSI